ncbi:M56 family metallopeptidase [Nocardioides nanhaiensis]|uniref:Peptidase M48 domain-containing protein n=1 Tax=Nocardioides nanhaiensis TaxID=1476871 RepID=A0ABP8X2X2_9ACTN
MLTPVLLGALAVLLAGPAPRLLARAAAVRHTPRAALVLWQGVALAAVLAALGAGLALATHQAWRRAPDPVSVAVAGLALLVTAVVLGRLLLTAHRTGTRLRALRRRHRRHLDLLGQRDEAVGEGVLVLEHEVPVAYCLPGVGRSRVVLSAGALGRLEPDELVAVLAHERAHLRARHDLVLEAFSVLHRAFPRWVSSASALEEVRLLAEVLADRAAARRAGRAPLARALVTLAAGAAPEGSVGAADDVTGLRTRIELLREVRRRPVQAALVLAAAGALLVLPTAFVVGPWLGGL